MLNSGVFFDEHLGAGTGNGGEEELKFLLDCQNAGLKIYYVPTEIASVAQTESTWFHGFDEKLEQPPAYSGACPGRSLRALLYPAEAGNVRRGYFTSERSESDLPGHPKESFL